MKKLLLLAVGSLFLFAGCYKEEERPRAFDVLTSTHWKIDRHTAVSNGIVEPGVNCGIPFNLVFEKDSTGYYYYPVKCESGDADTLRFHWKVSTDQANLYLGWINGDPSANATVGLSGYSTEYGYARLRNGLYKKRFLDGMFVADTAK